MLATICVDDENVARTGYGTAPKVVDLFSGAGGLSLGFLACGCKIIAAADTDHAARATHKLNFARLSSTYVSLEDVRDLVPEQVFPPETRIDILLAGPPCQPFSRVGRAKLRYLSGGGAEAWVNDPRVALYQDVLRLIKAFRPLAFVIENVVELLRFGGRNIAEEIARRAHCLGYEVRYFVLQAAWYGVPQWRERLFIVGIQQQLGVIPFPPPITHVGHVPSGYLTSSPSRLKAFALRPSDHFVTDIAVVSEPRPFVTVREAIGDLPPITEHLRPQFRPLRGQARFIRYQVNTDTLPSDYVTLLRSWPGVPAPPYLDDHVIRHTPRDYPIFAHMRPGDQYPEALEAAWALVAERMRRLRESGVHVEPWSAEWVEMVREMVPPYDPDKFPNRWWKMEWDMPSRTLTAHLAHDSYTHIHPDSEQARTISIREAARLQSFPDGFRFAGSFNDRMRLIGNAVPPLLAWSLAKGLIGALRRGMNDGHATHFQVGRAPIGSRAH